MNDHSCYKISIHTFLFHMTPDSISIPLRRSSDVLDIVHVTSLSKTLISGNTANINYNECGSKVRLFPLNYRMNLFTT